MRNLGIVALCAMLGGCAASRQEVASRLGQEYVGKNVDVLVVQWGPPMNTFKMNTEDANAGGGLIGSLGGWGSMCARRLGIKSQT